MCPPVRAPTLSNRTDSEDRATAKTTTAMTMVVEDAEREEGEEEEGEEDEGEIPDDDCEGSGNS